MPAPSRRLSPSPVVWAALLGGAISLICAWPGYANYDVVSQLAQARSNYYWDWHPPFSTWLLGSLGGRGQLCLNQALLWGGLAFLAHCRWGSSWRGAAAVWAVGFSPPVFLFSGSRVTGICMGGSLLAAAGLLAFAEATPQPRRRRLALGGSLLLLLLAGLLRHNAAPALLPLAVWWAWRAARPATAPSRRVALGALVWLALVLVGAAIQWGLTDRRAFVYQHLLLFDLMGTSVRAGEVLLPDYVVEERRDRSLDLSVEGIRARYDPGEITTVVNPRLGLTLEPDQLSALRASWLDAVVRHPGAYAAHRWAVLREALGLVSHNRPRPPVSNSKAALPSGFLSHLHQRAQLSVVARNLLRGALYLLLIPVVLVASPRARRSPQAWALAASATFYAAPYVFVAMSSGFRYLWWSALVAVTLAVVRPGSEPRASSPAIVGATSGSASG